jgi:hypothetical protein
MLSNGDAAIFVAGFPVGSPFSSIGSVGPAFAGPQLFFQGFGQVDRWRQAVIKFSGLL